MVPKVKETKARRVDTNLKSKKVHTKSDLLLQVKALQEAYSDLEETNKKNTKVIETLKGQVASLKRERVTVDSQQTQTESDLNIKCDECNFEGRNEKELGWHMGKNHGWLNDQKDMDISIESQGTRYCEMCDYEARDVNDLLEHNDIEHTPSDFEGDDQTFFTCHFCQEDLSSKKDLKLHKKEVHSEKVSSCWNFSAGTCDFGDENCWFIHSNAKDQQKPAEYNCKLCDKVLANLSEYLRHRKRKHENTIPTCKNFLDRTCIYGNDNCWFKHGDNECEKESNINENNEIIKGIFKMMEKLTERIFQIEMKHKE